MSNRRTGELFRSDVINYLRGQGLVGAHDPFFAKRLSEIVASDIRPTHVGGIEPWTIDVRSRQGTDLSEALTEAAQAAKVAGTEWYVTILDRRGWPLQDAYAVVPLSIMARLFAGEIPRPGA